MEALQSLALSNSKHRSGERITYHASRRRDGTESTAISSSIEQKAQKWRTNHPPKPEQAVIVANQAIPSEQETAVPTGAVSRYEESHGAHSYPVERCTGLDEINLCGTQHELIPHVRTLCRLSPAREVDDAYSTVTSSAEEVLRGQHLD
ncbi:hypothetical protein PMIN06_011823 [Paraphaeosphaeria minitans]